jgi:hypothetical protein
MLTVLDMRFDKQITFYLKGNDKYNFETGKHESQLKEVATLWGNVTENTTERNMQTFGKYDKQAKIIRLIDNIDFNWSYLTIGLSSTQYTMLYKLHSLKTNSILVGETNVS